LNHRFGRDSIRLGTTAMATNGADVQVWATKQERRSPRYTTRADEMLVVRS
jgi:DNA polymerase V